MSQTVFISAGQNVGADPMRPRDLVDYRNAISALLADVSAYVFFHGTGDGSWTDDTGAWVYERSYVWGTAIPTPLALHELRTGLAQIARRFGQEAIGCTVHDPAYGPSYVSA